MTAPDGGASTQTVSTTYNSLTLATAVCHLISTRSVLLLRSSWRGCSVTQRSEYCASIDLSMLEGPHEHMHRVWQPVRQMHGSKPTHNSTLQCMDSSCEPPLPLWHTGCESPGLQALSYSLLGSLATQIAFDFSTDQRCYRAQMASSGNSLLRSE